MRTLYDQDGAIEVEINHKKVVWTDSDDVYVDSPKGQVYVGNLKWQDEHIYIHNIMALKHFVEKETT